MFESVIIHTCFGKCIGDVVHALHVFVMISVSKCVISPLYPIELEFRSKVQLRILHRHTHTHIYSGSLACIHILKRLPNSIMRILHLDNICGCTCCHYLLECVYAQAVSIYTGGDANNTWEPTARGCEE